MKEGLPPFRMEGADIVSKKRILIVEDEERLFSDPFLFLVVIKYGPPRDTM